MKNLKIFLFFLSVPFLSDAQSNWSLGVIGGVDVSNIDYSKTELEIEAFVSILQIRYGIDVSYKLNDKLSFQSGIRINSQGQGASQSELRWGNQHDGSGGFDPSIDPMEPFSSYSSRSEDSFLEIPLHVNYKIGGEKIKWYVTGGASPNIYLRSKQVTAINGNRSVTTSAVSNPDFNKFTFSLDLGFGLESNTSDMFSVFLQPMARYYIPTILKNNGDNLKLHYYNFGIEIGGRMDLGR